MTRNEISHIRDKASLNIMYFDGYFYSLEYFQIILK